MIKSLKFHPLEGFCTPQYFVKENKKGGGLHGHRFYYWRNEFSAQLHFTSPFFHKIDINFFCVTTLRRPILLLSWYDFFTILLYASLLSLFPPKHFPHVQMCHYIESIWNTLRCQIITARFLLGSVVEYPCCADFCGHVFLFLDHVIFIQTTFFTSIPVPCGFYSDWVFSKSCIRS